MLIVALKAVWDFFLSYGIGIATWITTVGIVATAWITFSEAKKRLRISWEIKNYSNTPEPLVEFYVTNIGSHTVAIASRGFKKFNGTENFSDVYQRKDLNEYDSTNLGFYVDKNSKYAFSLKEFEEIYFVYVQDIPEHKYKSYPHGYFKSHLKRFWYWIRKIN